MLSVNVVDSIVLALENALKIFSDFLDFGFFDVAVPIARNSKAFNVFHKGSPRKIARTIKTYKIQSVGKTACFCVRNSIKNLNRKT